MSVTYVKRVSCARLFSTPTRRIMLFNEYLALTKLFSSEQSVRVNLMQNYVGFEVFATVTDCSVVTYGL
jgi:hypothetical protein